VLLWLVYPLPLLLASLPLLLLLPPAPCADGVEP
jgi:hypothetical protein